MEPINFFNSIDYLEPKCNKCSAVLKYGLNTKFDSGLKGHVCNNCGEIVK
jgi:hypothetical protein